MTLKNADSVSLRGLGSDGTNKKRRRKGRGDCDKRRMIAIKEGIDKKGSPIGTRT